MIAIASSPTLHNDNETLFMHLETLYPHLRLGLLICLFLDGVS
jgi:hypothetical protein